MALLHDVSPPEARVDPDVAVTSWSLSDVGRARASRMLAQLWVTTIGRVVCSPETKARETADLLADHLGLVVEIRPGTGEIDRTSSGFVPPARQDELADRCFPEPDVSADGWETAVAAQRRVVWAGADVLDDSGVDVAIVGHGGVGTLLWCHLTDTGIGRRHDQPGQGHVWTFDGTTRRMVHGWLPIDAAPDGP